MVAIVKPADNTQVFVVELEGIVADGAPARAARSVPEPHASGVCGLAATPPARLEFDENVT